MTTEAVNVLKPPKRSLYCSEGVLTSFTYTLTNRIMPNITSPPTQRVTQKKSASADMTDEQLFVLIRENRDESAFNMLYKRYDKRLYAYCLRALGTPDGAKDAFQSIMSIIFEKRESFIGGSYAAWLFTIARHHVMKVGKRASRSTSLDEMSDGVEGLSESVSNGESMERDFLLQQSLDKAIAVLPEDLREAFTMKYCDGLQHEEIAEALEISLSLAKVRVFRAKQLLRTSLASFFEEVQK